jgi:HK97 family phage portal protein
VGWLKNFFKPKDLTVDEAFKLEDILGSGGPGWATSGRWVTEGKAYRASAVFACVQLISGAIANSPCLIYNGTRYDKTRTPAPNHRLSPILRFRPNPYTVAATMWKGLTADKLLHGNAYAVITRNAAGRPIALSRVLPGRVTVYQAWELGLDAKLGVPEERLIYKVWTDMGKQLVFDQADMLHVPNMGWDGKQGLSTLRAGAEGIAGLLDAQEHAGKFFGQGAHFNYALRYPTKVDRKKAEEIREYFSKQHRGLKNAFFPPLMTEGGEIQPFSVPPKDSQLVETREFNVIDICRYFGVPPVMIGETTKTTSWGSGVEQMARWFNIFTLNQHYTAFEQELEVKLFQGGGYFPEFDETEQLRGDTKTQWEAFNVARGSNTAPGVLTVNEIREALGFGPVDGGDEIYKPTGGETGTQNEGQTQDAV